MHAALSSSKLVSAFHVPLVKSTESRNLATDCQVMPDGGLFNQLFTVLFMKLFPDETAAQA